MVDYCLIMPTNGPAAFTYTVIKEVVDLGGRNLSFPKLSFDHLAEPTSWPKYHYSFTVTNLTEDSILFLKLKYGITAKETIE